MVTSHFSNLVFVQSPISGLSVIESDIKHDNFVTLYITI